MIHVYAPAPEYEFNLLHFNCPREVTGRRCGSRRAYGRWYEWHGATLVCWFCGQRWEDGEYMGGLRVPAQHQGSAEFRP